MHIRNVLPLLLAGVAACGGAPTAGPSPVTVAPPPGTITPAPAPFPAGLDPDYVRTIALVDADGRPNRWEGGPFRHCIAPEVNPDVVASVIAEMTSLSGIPRTESGPCNVQWIADYGRREHSYSELAGTATAIVSARVFLYQGGRPTALHEAGHVLGLGHSPRPNDLMNPTLRVDSFSSDELTVLAWMYGRR